MPRDTDPRIDAQKVVIPSGIPIKLLVGAEEECIHVHPSIIAKSSDFFKTAIKKDWLNESDRAIKLPDDEIHTITAYIHWLYSGTIMCETASAAPERNNVSGQKQEQYIRFAKLYALGERIIDLKLQNAAVDATIALLSEQDGPSTVYPGREAVSIIYESTPQDSPGRRLMVTVWHDYGECYWVRPRAEPKLHAEFMEDLLYLAMTSRETPLTNKLIDEDICDFPACIYHRHEEGKTCSGKVKARDMHDELFQALVEMS